MLVREEQHFLATRERPFQHGTRIARRADDATMTATECLQIGGRIDVRDRRDVPVGVEHFGNLGPALADLDEIGHVRHRTARSEEHTSELQSLMRISYAVFCLKKKK